ncbi:MAG: hypothetical protein ACLSA6_17160, partial [Holdemania massiliensis]
IHCGDDYISDTRLPEENRFIDGRSHAIRIFTSLSSFTELNQTLFTSNLRRKYRKFKVKPLIKRNFYLNRIVHNLWNSKLLLPILGALCNRLFLCGDIKHSNSFISRLLHEIMKQKLK